MAPDPRLRLEALSALSGCDVQSTSGASQLSPQDFVNVVALKEFYKQEGLTQLEYPSLGTVSLQDPDPDPDQDQDQDLYSAPAALAEGPSAPGPAGRRATMRINPEDFFHPQYDYDFTGITDGARTFLRGSEPYVRPCGWNRLGLRVTRRYDDGDDGWLGTGAAAWPVSYQGPGMDGSLGIILTRAAGDDAPEFLDAAAAALEGGATRGRGVYSAADVATAEAHCRRFKSAVDGKTYKVVLQNRINPETRRRCQRDGVWLVYVPTDLNHVQTRALVQDAMRPYGLLLKEA